jgi:phospholipid/cholesterol/gamma-HCH transport system permease protein
MASKATWFKTERVGDTLMLAVGGNWVIPTLADVDRALRSLAPGPVRKARFDLRALGRLDTAGAWVLHRTRRQLSLQGIAVEVEGATATHRTMFQCVESGEREQELERPEVSALSHLAETAGRGTVASFRATAELLEFVGETAVATLRVAVRPARVRFTSFVHHTQEVGLNAMPIVGLLSFLIGVVLAYQGADQLRNFGAEIFTVNLLGLAVLREMGIVLAAIIVAGRSGSAFTAQIGTMQVNEEIAAMRTLGLDPIELLVLPRVFALVLAMPLLAVFADFMGLLGGALMSNLALGITTVQFLERLQSAVPLSAFWVGLVKAPVFGALIALVGCREGLQVQGSAESVGRQTTKAVVISVFLVILVDALFSILFSYLKV